LDRGQGDIVDVRSETPAVDLKELLHYFLAEDLRALNRYGGTFALAAWDRAETAGLGRQRSDIDA
jgi:hypothetical protein